MKGGHDPAYYKAHLGAPEPGVLCAEFLRRSIGVPRTSTGPDLTALAALAGQCARRGCCQCRA